jgi:glutaconate CoA-transferase subunit A
MAEKWVSIKEAVDIIKDNDTVAVCESPLDRSPAALAMEIIRRGPHGLTLVSPWGGYSSDLLIGAGLVKRICTAYIGFESLGLAPCFRWAVENHGIEVEDYSNLTIFARLRAGATGVPFYPLKSILGSDILRDLARQGKAKEIECPFTGERVCIVPALTPDVTIMHVHRADPFGNLQVDGADWLAYDLAMSSKKVVASVEKEMGSRSSTILARNTIQGATIPGILVDAVTCVPYGAHPTSCLGHYNVDKDHLKRYVEESGDRDKLTRYLQRFVYGTRSHLDYLRLVGVSGPRVSKESRE